MNGKRHGNWIGREGRLEWFLRSPNLNPCDLLHLAKIIIHGLPSHAPVELQPLDVRVFSPFKSKLRSEFEQALLGYNAKKFEVFAFAELVTRSYDTALSRSKIVSGFSKTGLWCINKKCVDHTVVANITLTAPFSPDYKNLTQTMDLASRVCEVQPKYSNQTTRMLDYRALQQSFRKMSVLCLLVEM